MPRGAGQQFDHVERKSWRHPSLGGPHQRETRKDWGTQDMLVTSFPSEQAGVRAKRGLSSASVYSGIPEVKSSFLSLWGPKGLGIGFSQLLALFPFLEKLSSASSSPWILSRRTFSPGREVTGQPHAGDRLCRVWGCRSKPDPSADPVGVASRTPPLSLSAATGPLRASPRAAVPDQPERPLKFYAE